MTRHGPREQREQCKTKREGEAKPATAAEAAQRVVGDERLSDTWSRPVVGAVVRTQGAQQGPHQQQRETATHQGQPHAPADLAGPDATCGFSRTERHEHEHGVVMHGDRTDQARDHHDGPAPGIRALPCERGQGNTQCHEGVGSGLDGIAVIELTGEHDEHRRHG